MNRTMPYPCRSRSDSVRRINMSSEPGNESFFCALRPIQRILSLQEFGHANQVQRALQSLKAKPAPAKPEARPCGDAGDTAHASGSTLISTRAGQRRSSAHKRSTAQDARADPRKGTG